MNIILKLLPLYFPAPLKKKKLAQLFTITASAFGCDAPPARGLTFEQCLHQYAVFTKEQTEKHLKKAAGIKHLKKELYREAYRLGRKLRKEFHIATSREVMLTLKIIYNLLGIDFQSQAAGEILIQRCFFSRYYSPEICQVMSSLDEGLAAGLSAGGNLCFNQRITEGNSCCRANFVEKEVLP